MIKRLLTTVIGIPLLFVLLIFGNKYIMDVVIALLAVMGIHEYMKCCSNKFKPVYWMGYLASLTILGIHIIPHEYVLHYIISVIVFSVVLLFIQVVFTEMETNIVDIAITLFGIVYIVGFFTFAALLYSYENDGNRVGKLYMWYLFTATWGSDIFAYLIGRRFGKHKFSKISPKKSIEGCIAGVISGTLLTVIATVIFNNFCGMNINYVVIAIIGLVLTIAGQIGDFAASTIKRYADVKDFSNLIPGHGGIIDRFDSVIFAAPFAYYLIMLFI